jgi:ribosome-associated heat shock protein Hsp15
MKTPLETVRLDRWLSAARFYKTRTQAARACEGRKVKVNGITAKPHKFLHVGDNLTIHHRGRYRDIEVLALAQRGLPPAEARKLYHEEEKQPLSRENEELLALFKKVQKKVRPKFKGRPTKKERRELEKLRDNDKIPL